jgi:hypothetical protein
VLFVPHRAVLADDPEPADPIDPQPYIPPPILVEYNPFELLNVVEMGEGHYLATTEAEFGALLGQYADEAGFVGTIVWNDFNEATPLPACDYGDMHLRITVYDQDTLDGWSQTEYTPGFLQEPPMILETPPSIEEAAFDMTLWLHESAEVIGIYRMRVASADGAIAMVSAVHMTPAGEVIEPGDLPRAGPWHPLCCGVQAVFCTIGRQIAPHYCIKNCFVCSLSCRIYKINDDPCHRCDPCGVPSIIVGLLGN